MTIGEKLGLDKSKISGKNSKLERLKEDFADLLSKLLTWDPDKRYDAKQALKHRFFGVNKSNKR